MVSRTDPAQISAIAKVSYKALQIRGALLYRATDLAEAACILFEIDNLVSAVCITRAFQVTLAVLFYVNRKVGKTIEPEILGEVKDGAWLECGNVRLEKGSIVERGAIIRDPTIIGKNIVIRSTAYIRGHVMIGNECLIGNGTELRQILVLNQSNIPHGNCIFTSIIGNRVKIGGRTDTANMLFGGKKIEIHIEENGKKKIFPTGQTLFSVVIGDDSDIGGVCLFMPGTMLGKRCKVYPKCIVSNYIPADSTVKLKSKNYEVISSLSKNT